MPHPLSRPQAPNSQLFPESRGSGLYQGFLLFLLESPTAFNLLPSRTRKNYPLPVPLPHPRAQHPPSE